MAYLASKQRYEILDGLRGVAALMIVAFHLFETYSKGPEHQIINHGYLAVDFFFVLSGFVVSYAYDDRWDRMSLWAFFKRRIVRLHPLILAGGLLGLFVFYLSDSPHMPLVNDTPWHTALLIFVATLLMIPTIWVDGRGWMENFPMNSPQWSLLLEYIANVVYALVLRRLSTRVLCVLAAVAAIFSLDLGLGWNLLGDRPEHYWSDGTFIGGWIFDGWETHIAVVRLSYPFLAGMLVARFGRFITLRGGFWWCTGLILAVQCMPHVGHGFNNGIFDSLCILLLFPLIIAIGAGSTITGACSQKACKFLGDISYPIYITHFAFMYLQKSWAAGHPDMPLGAHITVAVSMFLLSIAVAYATLKLYDEPVREWLKEKWLKR